MSKGSGACTQAYRLGISSTRYALGAMTNSSGERNYIPHSKLPYPRPTFDQAAWEQRCQDIDSKRREAEINIMHDLNPKVGGIHHEREHAVPALSAAAD